MKIMKNEIKMILKNIGTKYIINFSDIFNTERL